MLRGRDPSACPTLLRVAVTRPGCREGPFTPLLIAALRLLYRINAKGLSNVRYSGGQVGRSYALLATFSGKFNSPIQRLLECCHQKMHFLLPRSAAFPLFSSTAHIQIEFSENASCD